MTAGAPGHFLPVPTGSVRDDLVAFLGFLRGAVVRKLEGISEDEARRSPVGSGTSLLGIVKHLATVEVYWVHRRVAGLEVAIDADRGLDVGPEDSVDGVVGDYRAVAARTDELLGACDLDAPLARSREGRTVGWVLVHLVEETARHAGHADILRELLDGAVGM